MERDGAYIRLEPDEVIELGISSPIHIDMIELKAIDDRLRDRGEEIAVLSTLDDPSVQENGQKMQEIERFQRAQRYAGTLSALVTEYEIEMLPVTENGEHLD